MAKGSGTNRTIGNKSAVSNNNAISSGLSLGQTEVGYSAVLATNILKVENGFKDQKNETIAIFNSDGSMSFRKDGTKMGVTFDGRLMTNKIMTHNHPGPDAPFSSSDLRDAVKFNVNEIRAVSRNYTFSMKRPQGGWGKVKPEAIMRTYGSIKRQVAKEWAPIFEKVSGGVEMRKTYFNSQVEIQKRIAKKYGWDFSIKKNK